MPNVLVVDDSPVDRIRAGKLIERDPRWEVSYAVDGKDALAQLIEQPVDVVVTDLQMPEMDGLELVDAIKHDQLGVPVVIMTSKGSEEIAVKALKHGAASYVPKNLLADQLLSEMNRISRATENDRLHFRLMHALLRGELVFEIQNDTELMDTLVNHFQEMLRCLPLGDETERIRVGIAVKEILLASHYFGNLEIDVASVTERGGDLQQIADERSQEMPYRDRYIQVTLQVSGEQAIIIIKHEGQGFHDVELSDLASVAENTSPLQRSFTLINSIMDTVEFVDQGTVITLTKKAIRFEDEESLLIEPA